MASFYIPLTGFLEADSTALNTIANDLSNMNTTAFKTQSANFSDLFYQQIGLAGSGDPIQVGAGVQVASIGSDFSQGALATTNNATDVALNGNGLFVVNNGGTNEYTRDGSFTLNSAGDLTTQGGLQVMGYPAVKGVVNTNSALSAINIPIGQVEPPQASSNFSLTANLDSSAAIGTSFPGQVTLYDSLGKSYVATVDFTNTAPGNWTYNITMPDTLTPASTTVAGVTTANYAFGSSGATLATVDPGTNLTITGPNGGGSTVTLTAPTVTPGETVGAYATALQAAATAAGLTGVTVSSTAGGVLTITGTNISTTGSVIQDPVATGASGSLVFNSNGDLVSPAGNQSGISFAGLSDGAATVNLNWNLFGANGTGNITQVDAASAVSATLQNGYSSGEYQSFTISNNGTVEATFSNGQTLAVGQIALANVANLQGLDLQGDGNFATTLASGSASVGTSGTAGLGTLTGGALEESNVNISSEFSNLIIAQRAFEANAKSVTTFDTITDETINMVH